MTLLKHLTHRSASILFACWAVMVVAPAMAQISAFEDPSSGNAAAGGGSQEFSPLKADIEGGDIAQGQLAQIIVMMRNNTSAPLSLQKVDLVPSSNVTATLVGNQCDKEPVKPGIECPITIAIKGESGGKYRVGILANHTGRSKISNLAISGNVSGGGAAGGMPSNEVEAFPVSINFGDAKGRTPLVRSIALRNASTKPITIGMIELAASPLTGFSVSAPECKELAPSAVCVATVTWTPTTPGKAEGTILLRHDGPSGTMQIALSAEYAPTKTEKAELFPDAISGQGLIVSDRDAVEFGTEIDGAASITVSLVNAGDEDVKLKQVRLAGSDNGLSLSTDGCATDKVLGPQQGCALTVNWLPRRKGPVIDDIQIIHNGARGVLVLPVRGTAKEVVTLNMPILGSSTMPRVSTTDLDEKMLEKAGTPAAAKSGSTEKAAAPAAPTGYGGFSGEFALASDPSALNGYRITSLSDTRAVVTGPRGRIIVKDGQPQVIAGGHWLPRVLTEGVELIGERDSVMLLFDRSLGAISATASNPEFSAAVGAPAAGGSDAPSPGGGATTP